MATVAFELLQGVQAAADAGGQVAGADITQIRRGEGGQKQHADIGRRGAVGDLAVGLFLVVVRRQPVVVGANEGFEEQPGTSRQLAEEGALGLIQLDHGRPARLGDAQGDFRGQQPEQQQGRGRQQGAAIEQCQQATQQHGKGRRGAHLPPDISVRTALGQDPRLVRGSGPFEQVLARHPEPPQGAAQRIERNHGIVDQKCQRQEPAAGMVAQPAQHALHRAAPTTGRQPGDQFGEQMASRYGHGQQRPDPGRAGQPQPAGRHQGYQ